MSSEFARAFANEILPLLRQQKGFKGELALANPGSMESIAISVWASKADPDAYLAKRGKIVEFPAPKKKSHEIPVGTAAVQRKRLWHLL